jgi:phosphopantetheinyl transferase
LKEAYLKARGLGIAVHLADLSFTIGDRGIQLECRNALDAGGDWAFALVEADDTHFLAAAAPVIGGVRPTFTIAPFPMGLAP